MLSWWESCPRELKPQCLLGAFRCSALVWMDVGSGNMLKWGYVAPYCDPSVWVFWEVGQEGPGSTLGDQGCSGISSGIFLGSGVGKLWPWSNSIQGRAFPGVAKRLCTAAVLVSLGYPLCPLGSWALVTGGLSQMNPKWRGAPPRSSLGHPCGSHTGRGGWLW